MIPEMIPLSALHIFRATKSTQHFVENHEALCEMSAFFCVWKKYEMKLPKMCVIEHFAVFFL